MISSSFDASRVGKLTGTFLSVSQISMRLKNDVFMVRAVSGLQSFQTPHRRHRVFRFQQTVAKPTLIAKELRTCEHGISGAVSPVSTPVICAFTVFLRACHVIRAPVGQPLNCLSFFRRASWWNWWQQQACGGQTVCIFNHAFSLMSCV